MTSLDYGDDPPPILPVAEGIYTVLDLHRAFGTIPIHANVRVYIAGTNLMVALGGLDDGYLLGEHADKAPQRQLGAEYYTSAALQLRRHIEDAVMAELPRRGDGQPWFPFMVWLQPEHWAAQYGYHDHGVTVLPQGEST
ncbi:hypothetical protein [Amycolatopsis sp. MtRt-6]|uniref:hypothetical protein n=1 Tax=Amycolatopsis sp. MtRt-6 TaxID=2792782 RepID=UPI001A8E8942|nr:hypothetical protein [Amycolatopsis sp. MtRt-6]